MALSGRAKRRRSVKPATAPSPPLMVTVRFDGGSILADPLRRRVPKGFRGRILWKIEGDFEFDPDGIVFSDGSIATLRGADSRTYSADVSNEPGQNGVQFPYTIHVKGQKKEDPVVQNDPPPDEAGWGAEGKRKG